MSKKIKATTAQAASKPQTAVPTTAINAKIFSLESFRAQAIILALIGFIFYCNTFQHEAAFDDRMAITDNTYVQSGIAGIPDILTHDAYQSYLEHKNGGNQLAGGRYRPLSLVTFAIEQQFMGVNNDADATTSKQAADEREATIAGQMHVRHVINVLLYILSVIVLLYFLRAVVFPAQTQIAFLAALVFTVHPVHTEVVANVKSRDEILSVLFISLTFILAHRYTVQKKFRDLALASVSFFLALLSKEYAATLLVLLPLSFYIFRQDTVPKSIKATLPYLIPFALYMLLRATSVSGAVEGAENNILNNPYLYATSSQKIATEILVLLDYLKLLLFPHPLSADYSYSQIPYTSFANPLVWLSIAIYASLIAGMILLIKKRQVSGFAIAVYLLNLLLVANIFFNIGAPMGERLIYHSSIGFSIAVAYLLFYVQGKMGKQVFIAIICLLVVLCGITTIARNKDWKNDETLFLTDVTKVPNSVLANNNAAAACMYFAKREQDKAARNEWFLKAIRYFDKAISIYPGYNNARMNRGLCYFDMGQHDKAIPDWDSVRAHAPDQPQLAYYLSVAGKYFFNQGMKYAQHNSTDSAIIAFTKSADAAPAIAEPLNQLGVLYMNTGRYAEARSVLQKSLQLTPGNTQVKQLYEQALNMQNKK